MALRLVNLAGETILEIEETCEGLDAKDFAGLKLSLHALSHTISIEYVISYMRCIEVIPSFVRFFR